MYHMQPYVDLWGVCGPPWALNLDLKDQWRDNMGPCHLHFCMESHVVTFDLFRVTPGSTISVHMAEQHGVA